MCLWYALQARTEAEHMRQECHRLQDELLHKEAQLEDVQVSMLAGGA